MKDSLFTIGKVTELMDVEPVLAAFEPLDGPCNGGGATGNSLGQLQLTFDLEINVVAVARKRTNAHWGKEGEESERAEERKSEPTHYINPFCIRLGKTTN